MGDEPQDGAAAGLGERVQRLFHLDVPGIGWLGKGRGWAMSHGFVPYR